MDITNRIIVALLERMKSRNKNFSLSKPKFHRLFQINPDGYLWYGEKLERHLLNKYGESADSITLSIIKQKRNDKRRSIYFIKFPFL